MYEMSEKEILEDTKSCEQCSEPSFEESSETELNQEETIVIEEPKMSTRKRVFTILSVITIYIALFLFLFGVLIEDVTFSFGNDGTKFFYEGISLIQLLKKILDVSKSVYDSYGNVGYYGFVSYETFSTFALCVLSCLLPFIFAPFIIINGIKVLKGKSDSINYKMPAVMAMFFVLTSTFISSYLFIYKKDGEAFARTFLGLGTTTSTFSGTTFVVFSLIFNELKEKKPIINLVSKSLLFFTVCAGSLLSLIMLTPVLSLRISETRIEEMPLSAGLETALKLNASSSGYEKEIIMFGAGYIFGILSILLFSLAILFGIIRKSTLHFAFNSGSFFALVLSSILTMIGFFMFNENSANGIGFSILYLLMIICFICLLVYTVGSFVTHIIAKKKA